MNVEDMLERTKAFALRIIKMVRALPKGRDADVLGRQVLKSGTSIGANYREAQRASSKKQFISTMEIVQRETHETDYWIELIRDSGMVPAQRLGNIADECRQLLAIITATIRTAKKRRNDNER